MTTAIPKVDRILTNATVITMDAQWQIFSPGAIAITGSAIVAVEEATVSITVKKMEAKISVVNILLTRWKAAE